MKRRFWPFDWSQKGEEWLFSRGVIWDNIVNFTSKKRKKNKKKVFTFQLGRREGNAPIFSLPDVKGLLERNEFKKP